MDNLNEQVNAPEKRRGCTQSQNHPKKGSRTKMHPIREKHHIEQIKEMLQGNYRNLLIFVLGINTGYRANELVSIKVHQVRGKKAGDILEVYQTKTHKYRRVTLSESVLFVVNLYLSEKDLKDDDYLFKGHKGPLTAPYVYKLVKSWCKEINLTGNYGSHTLRKTWGYHQRKYNNQNIAVLMHAFGHTHQSQTLNYLCVESEEVEEMFKYEI